MSSLTNTFNRGLIGKTSYLRLALSEPRYFQGDNYTVNIPIAGTTLQETLAEAAFLVRDGHAVISIPNPFTITWFEPASLPAYTPSAVRQMRVSGRGFLYFALGAENPERSQSQVVDPTRYYGYYSMSAGDFLGELSRILEKTATAEISSLRVTWLNKAPGTREFTNLTDAVTQLRTEINQAIANSGSNGTIDLSQITNQLDILAGEINDRQLRGDYAPLNHEQGISTILGLQEVITQILQAVDNRAPLIHAHNIDAIANLQAKLTQIDTQIEKQQASSFSAWGRLNLISGTILTGFGIDRFEPNPDNDSPGAYRVYLSTAVPNYTLLLNSSDAEGAFMVANVQRQTPNYFDFAIADIYGVEQPSTEVSLALVSPYAVKPGFSISINCGQTQLVNPILDTAGNYWIRDCYFSGGTVGDNGVSNTTGTDVSAVFRFERFGTSTYTIPVPTGSYSVNLFFAENFHTAIGQRVFNVDIQGTRRLTNFDIFREAGGGRRAIARKFPGVSSANNQIVVSIQNPGTLMGLQIVRE